jgi:hypothetical protein
MGIIRPIEILGCFSDEDMDIIREVLGEGKAFESIGREILLQREMISERCMNSDGLSCEPADPVDDHLVGYLKKPGEGTDSATTLGDVGEDLLIRKMFFHPVIEGEGL